jgi:hypothetical protein
MPELDRMRHVGHDAELERRPLRDDHVIVVQSCEEVESNKDVIEMIRDN